MFSPTYLIVAFGAWNVFLVVDAYQVPAAEFVVLQPKGFEVSIPGEICAGLDIWVIAQMHAILFMAPFIYICIYILNVRNHCVGSVKCCTGLHIYLKFAMEKRTYNINQFLA